MDIRRQIELEDAVEAGDVGRAMRLLEAGAEADATCHALDRPILDIAIDNEDQLMARLLLDHGARLGVTDAEGRTRLHRAAGATDDNGTLELLLALGTDTDTEDAQGWTALHFSAAYGYVINTAKLLAAGADPAVRTRHGLLPLDLAVRNGHGAAAELLRSASVR